MATTEAGSDILSVAEDGDASPLEKLATWRSSTLKENAPMRMACGRRSGLKELGRLVADGHVPRWR